MVDGWPKVGKNSSCQEVNRTENEMPLTPHQVNLMKADGYGEEACTQVAEQIDAGDVEMCWALIQADHPEVTE